AARNAFFSVSYVKVGLTPDGGATSFLAESCPRQLLTELCLTGDRISAERLHALGAVNRLVDAGTALAEALAFATRLAAGPQRGVGPGGGDDGARCPARAGSRVDGRVAGRRRGGRGHRRVPGKAHAGLRRAARQGQVIHPPPARYDMHAPFAPRFPIRSLA